MLMWHPAEIFISGDKNLAKTRLTGDGYANKNFFV